MPNGTSLSSPRLDIPSCQEQKEEQGKQHHAQPHRMTLLREPWTDDKEVNGGNAYLCAQTPPPLKAEESCARRLPPQSRQVPPPPPPEGGSTLHDPQRHDQVNKEVNTTFRAQSPPPVGGGDTCKATFTQNEASAPAPRKPLYTQHSRAPRLSQRPLTRRQHSKNATSPQQRNCS